MTKGTIVAGLVIALVVAIAWTRDVARAADTAERDRLYELAMVDLAAHRVLLAEAEARTARIDTVTIVETRIIDRGLVQAQRLADSLNRLLPALANAQTATDSIPILLQALDVRRLETIELRTTLAASERLRSVVTVDRDAWHALALSGDSVTIKVVDVLEAERDARACRILGTIKAPCIPNSLKVAGISIGAVMLWEKVIRPLVRIP